MCGDEKTVTYTAYKFVLIWILFYFTHNLSTVQKANVQLAYIFSEQHTCSFNRMHVEAASTLLSLINYEKWVFGNKPSVRI